MVVVTGQIFACPRALSAYVCMAAVVRQGEIVEQGSHGELIQIPNGAYATLVRLQASAQQPAMQQKQQVADEISHQLQHSADPEVLKKVITSQVCSLLCYAFKVFFKINL